MHVCFVVLDLVLEY